MHDRGIAYCVTLCHNFASTEKKICQWTAHGLLLLDGRLLWIFENVLFIIGVIAVLGWEHLIII